MQIPPARPLLRFFWIVNLLWTGLWYRLRRIGPCTVPAHGPVILTANHGSTADPLMLYATCPSRLMGYMIAREYSNLPVVWRLIAAVGCIPVNRSGVDTAATKAAIRRLRDGGMLGIFIEGRIPNPGEPPSPKDGVALLALQTGAVVVPAYISGLRYHRDAASSFFAWHDVRVRYGQPVDLRDIAGKDRAAVREATTRIWSAIQRLRDAP